MARIRSIHQKFWKPENQAWGTARAHLYVIQEGDNGPLKIGIAGHPNRRLGMLQSGNYRRLYLRAVYEGTDTACKQIEHYAHRAFERAGGEWFYADLEDVVKFLSIFDDGDFA